MKSHQTRQSFMKHALISRQQVLKTGLVIDGALFGKYLRAKVRGVFSNKPESKEIKFLQRPISTSSFFEPTKASDSNKTGRLYSTPSIHTKLVPIDY